MNESDMVSAWLSDSDFNDAIFEDLEPIRIYNQWCNTYDIDGSIKASLPDESDNYVEKCINNWNMPPEYTNIDIYKYTLDRCPDEIDYMTRVCEELKEYENRGMLPVLNFLIYLVDVCKENNIVLGVGRGSSVASYVLFILGIHKIDSVKYELDIKEFLK
jgi:DNA polymerase III alpha subunit